MTFTVEAQRSVSQHRVLVELDIGIPNTQWVNNGAGIWTVSPLNIYPWVGPPNQEMVARYALDGDSTDSTGNGNHGTDTDITYEAGFAGQAARFVPPTSKIVIPDLLSGGGAWSISVWAKFPSSASNQTVFSQTDGTVEFWLVKLRSGLTDKYRLEYDGPGRILFDTATNDWVHLVLTYDGTTLLGYADGVEVDSFVGAISIDAASGLIGAQTGNVNVANGLVDEARFYDRVITATEVTELFTRNYDAEYFLTGFTAQGFLPLGSFKANGASLQRATSVLDLADTPNAWYADYQTPMYYITLPDFDEPSLYSMSIGQIFSYARGAFTPINGPVPVEGRLLNSPAPSESRDPLFFGRFRYPSWSIQLRNGDGFFNTWGRDTDIYGNDARILVGFEDLDYSEYRRVNTGFMQNVNVNEETMNISVSDKRKQLTKPITYATTNTNALTAIEEILAEAYAYTFDSTFYDLTAWNIAKALVANITLNYQKPAAVIDVIEYIASSVFGLFRVDADGLFSFKVIDTTDSIETLIPAVDISNAHSINYNPTEVVSSVRIGYARDWTAASGDQYTYYTDDLREDAVFNIYKTYQEKTFDTALIDEAAAIAFATRVLDYTDTVRGAETILVPLANYALTLGDQVGVVTQRGEQAMLGERKAEIVSIAYALDVPQMRIGIRLGDETESVRITEAGAIRITEAEAIRVVE